MPLSRFTDAKRATTHANRSKPHQSEGQCVQCHRSHSCEGSHHNSPTSGVFPAHKQTTAVGQAMCMTISPTAASTISRSALNSSVANCMKNILLDCSENDITVRLQFMCGESMCLSILPNCSENDITVRLQFICCKEK